MLKMVATADPRRCGATILGRFAAAALALACSLGWAGPQEQYDQAAKAYREGDVTGAMRIVREPAEAGHAPSQTLYGMLLESAGLFEDSVAYLRKAAGQGDLEAMFGLAGALAAGQGVAKDHAQARQLFENAAGRGHRQSVEVLAEAAMRGGLGVEKNASLDAKSLEWIRKAADGNHLASLDFLAAGYRDGSVGAVDAKLAQQYEARAEKLRYPNGRPRRTRHR